MKHPRIWWLTVTVLICSGNLARAQDGNFFEIRGLFPPEGGQFSTAPALDAAVRLPVADLGVFDLRLTNLTLVRQRVQAQFSAEAAFFGLRFRNEPGEELNARSLELNAIGAYKNSGNDPVVLRGLTLAYSLDTDTSPSAGYSLQSGQADAEGDIVQDWNWSLGYSLANSLIPANLGLEHDLQSWVRTTVFKPIGLGVGLGYTIKDQRFAVKGSLEGSYEITPLDTLGLRLTLTTTPGDAEELFYDTSRFDPLSISLKIGRSSEAFVTWGGSISTGDRLQFSLSYDGQAGAQAIHALDLGIGYAGDAGRVNLRGGVRAELDPKTGLWYARLDGQLAANLSLEAFKLEAIGQINFSPTAMIGRFTANGQWLIPPFAVLLSADFRFQNAITGEASVQGLYFFLPGIAINLTGFYRAQPAWEGPSGFGVGLGLMATF